MRRNSRWLLAALICALVVLGVFRTLRVRAYQHNLVGTWRHTTWIPGSTESYTADGMVRFTTILPDSLGSSDQAAQIHGESTYSFVGLLGNYLRFGGDQSNDRKIVQLSTDTLILTQYDEQPPYVLKKVAP